MPDFETMPLDEAKKHSASASNSGAAAEYLGYIRCLVPGQAGKLQIRDGERVGTVRMRLSAAARSIGKPIVIRRVGNDLLFWLTADESNTTPDNIVPHPSVQARSRRPTG